MKETQFKALMHCGKYVDANLLNEGIYTTSRPYIYSKDDTIELMIKLGRTLEATIGGNFLSETYFDNLKQCQLAPIVITEVNE